MKPTLPVLFACALGLAACGGAAEEGATEPVAAEPAAVEPETDEHAGHGEHGEHGEHGGHGAEEDHDHHHDFPGQMKAFHDMLAPLWHADEGEERARNTCVALDDLIAASGEVKADVPEGVDEDAWTGGADELTAALEELKSSSCPPEELVVFQEKFTAVHDAFHVLVDLVGEPH